MSLLNLSTNLPVTPGAVGSALSFTLSANSPQRALGALLLQLRIPEHLCDNVSITPLAFDAAGDAGFAVSGPLGDSGLYRIAGAGLGTSAGDLDLLSISLVPQVLAGGNIPIEAEVVEAFAVDGWPLRFAPLQFELAVASAPLSIETGLAQGRATLAYFAPLRASGGTPPYTWTLNNSSLPAEIQLHAEGYLQGVPPQSGNFTLNVSVSDSASPAASVSADLSVHIGAVPLSIGTRTLPPAAANAPYSALLETSGGEGAVSWDAQGLPAGLAINGDRIEGTPDSVPDDFAPASIVLIATDSADSPNSTEREVSLPFVADLPDAVLSTDSPVSHVAVGADLMLADYRVSIDADIIRPPRDRAFLDQVEEAQAAILDELIDVTLCPPEPDGGVPRPVGGPPGDDGFPTGGGPGGPGGGYDDEYGGGYGMDYGPSQPIDDSPCIGIRFPGDDDGPTVTNRSEYVSALIGWYRELESWKRGSAPVSYDICIDVDGDEILCADVGFKRRLKVQQMQQRNATSLYSASSLARTLLPVVREPVRWMLRSRMQNCIDSLFSSSAEKVAADSAAVKQDQRTARGAIEFDIDSFEDLQGALSANHVRKNVTLPRRYRFGFLAAGLAFGAMAGGASGLLWMGALSAIAISAASAWLGSDIARRADAMFDDLVGRIGPIVQIDPPDAATTVKLTPGAHRVTARWQRTSHGRGGYGAAGGSASMGFRATFDPRNPHNWPRLKGQTVIAKGGLHTSGSQSFDVSLTNSDVDVLVVTNDAQLQLFPAKGDGGYGEARDFGANAQTGRLAVEVLDDIGRSSVVAINPSQLRIFHNDGIRGFTQRNAILPDQGTSGVHALAAARLSSDGWGQLLLAMESRIVVAQGLQENLSAATSLAYLESSPQFAIDGETISSLTTYGDGGIDGVVACGRYSGMLLDLSSVNPSTDPVVLDGGIPLPPLDSFDPALQPMGSALSDQGQYLAIALRQAKQLVIFERGDAWVETANLALPVRPDAVTAAPTGMTGWVVANSQLGVVLLVRKKADGGFELAPLSRTDGAPLLARFGHTLAVAASGQTELSVYRQAAG